MIWYNPSITCADYQQYSSNLLMHWDFEEGTGSVVNDLSGNGNNGTINGATWSTDVPNQTCGGCTATDSVYVDLFQAEIVQEDTTICFGDSVTLDALTSSAVVSYDSVLVDQFTMTFGSQFTYNTSSFDNNKTYKMYVNGRYGVADWWSGCDAAFNYYWDTLTMTKVNCNGTQDAQRYGPWEFNGQSMIQYSRPDNDVDNNCCFCSGSDKQYVWTLAGLSGLVNYFFYRWWWLW